MIYIFTQATNYGEFVEVVKADTLEEAYQHLQYKAEYYDLGTTITGNEPNGKIWHGGGDSG